MESTHATAADAELILRLYDLRRETEMRKARNWFAGEFWPRSFSDVEQTMMQFGSPQSRWLGQVLSYWNMAATFVVQGALSPALFTRHLPRSLVLLCEVKAVPAGRPHEIRLRFYGQS